MRFWGKVYKLPDSGGKCTCFRILYVGGVPAGRRRERVVGISIAGTD